MDLYLQGATPEQALAAVQQMASIMANGGRWQRVGYEPLDELCDYVVCMAHAALNHGMQDRDALAGMLAYVAENRMAVSA